MFRKFVVPGWKRRWEISKRKTADGSRAFKYNEVGEFFTEGAYISFGRFVGNMGKDLLRFKWDLVGGHIKGLTTVERANVKRTMTEIIALMGMYLMGNIFLTLRGEADDDSEKRLYSHAAYQFLRIKSELFFFSNPLEAMKILKSPAASMSLIENVIRAAEVLFNPFDDEGWGARFETGPWKGSLKINKHFINTLPVARQIPKLIDIDSQMRWFK